MPATLPERVAEELFTILPLVGRGIRRRLIKTASGLEPGISPPQLEVLKTLQAEGRLNITGIAERLQIPAPQMTHLLDRLAEAGLVERQHDEHDRRTINIWLTARGRNALEKYEQAIRQAIRASLSDLTKEELERLSASLHTLYDLVGRMR